MGDPLPRTLDADGKYNPAIARRSVSVLAIDDDPDTRELLGLIVTNAGYSFAEADNGCDALAVLKSIRPQMILLDIQMPVMDGAEFRQAQRRDPDLIRVPTVVMTGSKEEPQLDLSVVETLTKPFRGDELLAIVARYCQRTA
jgi:CheY-like chemotaxis protein